jgi:hypothetical protein
VHVSCAHTQHRNRQQLVQIVWVASCVSIGRGLWEYPLLANDGYD